MRGICEVYARYMLSICFLLVIINKKSLCIYCIYFGYAEHMLLISYNKYIAYINHIYIRYTEHMLFTSYNKHT